MKSNCCFKKAAGEGFQVNMLTALALWACLPMGSLLAASPDIQYTEPTGGQRGTEVQVKVVGSRLWDAEEVLFYQPGVTLKEIKHDEKGSGSFFTATFVVAPDAALGEHTYRVRTKSGLTYARRFWISQFPNQVEVDPNNLFEKPQDIPMNVTVDGTSKPETADYFRVNAKKGERISVEVEGLRANQMGQRVGIDPYCAILNKDRFEIVASDDTALLKQDCYVSTIAPEDGQYIIEVRDAAYEGSGRYRAHIGNFPRPKAIYPAGGKAGSQVEVTLLGDEKGDYKTTVALPAEPTENFSVFAAHEGLTPPSANKMRVSAYDNVLEDESKNDEWKTLDKSAGVLPLAFNGILQENGDIDYFRFTAKKGQAFKIRALARNLNSPVDTVLTVYNDKGGGVGSSDDADGSADARVDFTAPADGDYFVRVNDMLQRGGEDYVYRIETEVATPALLLTMPEYIRNDNQHRKMMEIPRGGRFAAIVNVVRQGVKGDVKFEGVDLPPGVTVLADSLPANGTQFPVVFQAAADAPIGGKLSALYGVANDPDKPGFKGRYTEMLDYVRGEPNGTLYYSRTEDKLPVAVCEEAPFQLELVQPITPIVRDGVGTVTVRATRQAGFTKPITVRWMWNPPGISCNSTVTIPEGQNEATFSLTANGNSEVRTWQVCVLGETDLGKGIIRNASPLAPMEVGDHFVKATLQLATVFQGNKGEVLVDMEGVRDFPSDAKVKLVGLPAKSVGEEVVMKNGQEQIKIPVTTQAETPVGQHKNIFCELTFTHNGKTITQRAGYGGVFRVDPKPKEAPKPAVAAAGAPKAATPAAPAPAKPLSRLEQLRLDAQKAAQEKK